MSTRKKTRITATIWFDSQPKHIELKGQNARTLLALAQAGQKGITALDVSATWAYRLAAYVYDLRHDYSMDIVTQREEHEDGWHARYVLLTPVEILDADTK